MKLSLFQRIKSVNKCFSKLYTAKLSSILALALCIPLSASAFANSDNGAMSAIASPHFDIFRVAEHAVLPASRKIYVKDITAEFSASWKMEFGGQTSKNYKARVLRDYSKVLKAHLEDKLAESGWKVIDTPEEGVLVVNAVLKDLYLEGPQKLTREHILVSNIGKSSILVTVDGADKNPIFEIEDRQNISGFDSFFVEADNAINYARFNTVMESWASKFVAYLDLTSSEYGTS